MDIEKLEKCMIEVTEFVKNGAGQIIIPSGVFESINSLCRLFAYKPKGSDFIKMLPITNPNAKVFEIFAEVEWKTAHLLIRAIAQLVSMDKDIKFIPDQSGTCAGEEGTSCTYDGFIVIHKNHQQKIKKLEDGLLKVEKKGKKIIRSISISEVV